MRTAGSLISGVRCRVFIVVFSQNVESPTIPGRFSKKKQHTLKAQVIVHWQTGLILDVQTCKGSIHDFKLYKDTCPDWLPDNAKLLADSGYQGIAKLHEQSFTPFKKPRGGQLLEI